jgi:2-polyprenyl-3-methyl-5-hydroxy-6-metoxy-1,4-benzoquinol methylase
MNKSHLTAISRKWPSAPIRWLSQQGLLKGKKLDFGCGKGLDADMYGMEKYDPFWFKCDDFAPSEFDTITCIYVLNVIEDFKERQAAVELMQHWLKPDGNLYIAVRADINRLKGYTKRGTWQGYIVLGNKKLCSTPNFDMYHLTKG